MKAPGVEDVNALALGRWSAMRASTNKMEQPDSPLNTHALTTGNVAYVACEACEGLIHARPKMSPKLQVRAKSEVHVPAP